MYLFVSKAGSTSSNCFSGVVYVHQMSLDLSLLYIFEPLLILSLSYNLRQSCFYKNYIKVVIHVEMPKAASKKSICHFQKLKMILK